MTAEPDTILQPSLHTEHELCQLLLDECSSRSLDVSAMQAEFDNEGDDCAWYDELIWECLALLSDAGYANTLEYDTLLIMPRGVPLPEDWQE